MPLISIIRPEHNDACLHVQMDYCGCCFSSLFEIKSMVLLHYSSLLSVWFSIHTASACCLRCHKSTSKHPCLSAWNILYDITCSSLIGILKHTSLNPLTCNICLFLCKVKFLIFLKSECKLLTKVCI